MKKIKQVVGLADTRSFILYVISGSTSTAMSYGLFSLCYGFFHLQYQVALTIGFFSSALYNFLFNRHFTFRGHSHAAHVQFVKYTVLLVGNYFANLGIAHIFVAYVHLSPYLAVMISLGSMVGVTYIISKYWVFQRS